MSVRRSPEREYATSAILISVLFGLLFLGCQLFSPSTTPPPVRELSLTPAALPWLELKRPTNAASLPLLCIQESLNFQGVSPGLGRGIRASRLSEVLSAKRVLSRVVTFCLESVPQPWPLQISQEDLAQLETALAVESDAGESRKLALPKVRADDSKLDLSRSRE